MDAFIELARFMDPDNKKNREYLKLMYQSRSREDALCNSHLHFGE